MTNGMMINSGMIGDNCYGNCPPVDSTILGFIDNHPLFFMLGIVIIISLIVYLGIRRKK